MCENISTLMKNRDGCLFFSHAVVTKPGPFPGKQISLQVAWKDDLIQLPREETAAAAAAAEMACGRPFVNERKHIVFPRHRIVDYSLWSREEMLLT